MAASPRTSGTNAPRQRADRAVTLVSLVALVAVLKIALGLALLAVGAAQGFAIPARALLFPVYAVTYAIAGLLLVGGGHADRRAALLGTIFLLVASVFADQLWFPFEHRHGPLLIAARGVFALQVDAFIPALLWTFVRVFPRAPSTQTIDGWIGRAIQLSLAAGGVLFVANILGFVGWYVPGLRPAVVVALMRRSPYGLYWLIELLLVLPSLGMLYVRTRSAPRDERRRVRLLVAGVLAGGFPTVGWVVLSSVVPGFVRLLPLDVAGWVIYPALLSIPFTTGYAVRMHRALDVRIIVRLALQYLLARYSVVTVTTVPLVLLGVSLYRNRHERLGDLAATRGGIALAGLTVVGLAALRWGDRLLAWVDARFFREGYEPHAVVSRILEGGRLARTLPALAVVLTGELERALHPDAVHVLFLDPAVGEFSAPGGDVRPLDVDSSLARLLARSGGPIDVDLEKPSDEVEALIQPDRHWLADGGVSLILPVTNPDQSIVAVIALGEKRSELPYHDRDRALLLTVAGATSMALTYHRHERDANDDRGTVHEQCAAECVRCGAVQPRTDACCAVCGGQTIEAMVPQIVSGKFLVERRIGSGGMGIVYRGIDTTLDRLVAIKTLPFVSPDGAARLRREARTMATVTHENLAVIYGAETSQGRPMLVVEYLGGGTLADRLTAGARSPSDAIKVGTALASGLAAIHRAGVLHGDIKPANIGFTSNGTAKLLDFGLARLITAADGATSHDGAPLDDARQVLVDGRTDHAGSSSTLLGTPGYMSPELCAGYPASAHDDLWSLCVALYEAATGEHPIEAGHRTAAAHTRDDVPDVRLFVPDASESVATFFWEALAIDRRHRPQSAEELCTRLRRLSA